MLAFAAVVLVLSAPVPNDHVLPQAGDNYFAAGGGGKCLYNYVVHDSTPVVYRANCTITSADLNHGTEPGHWVQHYVRALGNHDNCDNDDAGHILANHLGGLAEPTNLFPQSPNLNRGAWNQYEAAIYDCLKPGGAEKAELSWTFSYESSSHTRPNRATYRQAYTGGTCSDGEQGFSNSCDDKGGAMEAAPAKETA